MSVYRTIGPMVYVETVIIHLNANNLQQMSIFRFMNTWEGRMDEELYKWSRLLDRDGRPAHTW